MAKKQPTPNEGLEAGDLPLVVQELSRIAETLANAAGQMTQAMQMMQQMMKAPPTPTQVARPVAEADVQILTWEDDPFSESSPTDNPPRATPIQVPLPANEQEQLPFTIVGPAPEAGLHSVGSSEFRYWTAMEALTRGINFWGPLLPTGTVWSAMESPMKVNLEAGVTLNANYSREAGLRFFKDTVKGQEIFSGESPDVSCHELGHAILDAVRPELFDAASGEVDAFHESFGDMSSILSALQIESLRTKVIQETDGHLNVNSRLSRLAEQMGWAIRQRSPGGVDSDCLRNAANRWFYQDPDTLPALAPASQLCSEAHSFSRVFTGAFLDALARMVSLLGPVTPATLLTASRDLGQLLADSVRLAPITSGYFSQVAAAIIQADQSRNQGKYRTALNSSFIQHGVLTPSSVTDLAQAPTPNMVSSGRGMIAQMMPVFGGESQGYLKTGQNAPKLPLRSVTTSFGLTLDVHAAAEPSRYQVASAAPGGTPEQTHSAEDEARAFIEDLVQHGRLDVDSVENHNTAQLAAPDRSGRNKHTHVLVRVPNGKITLKRRHFDCPFCHRR